MERLIATLTKMNKIGSTRPNDVDVNDVGFRVTINPDVVVNIHELNSLGFDFDVELVEYDGDHSYVECKWK